MTPDQKKPDKTGTEKNAVSEREHPIIIYRADNANISVNVRYSGETFWLTQKAMAELFDCSIDTISLHLKHIFEEEELSEKATVEESSIVQTEGTRQITRRVKFYSLDAVISVGYRINSKKATRFRQWATQTLKEYITKGFVLNDDLLKNGKPFGKDYFDELLERIREIRASERRAYQKITDIFQQCSSDYDKESDITKEFYATIQNKLHFAATGKTAAELISERADANHPTMGLTTWKDAPDGKIYLKDITTAKNYLNETELKRLNRLVTMFIDYAELMAEDNIIMTMQDWAHQTDIFLKNNRRNILTNAGHITHSEAEQHAREEYKEFRKKQDRKYLSDFDREMEKYYKGEEN